MLELWDELKRIDRRLQELSRELLTTRSHTTGHFAPASDVYARNGDLVVHVELPGVDPNKDVTVTLQDGDLSVRGERKASKEIREQDYVRRESSYGVFERHVAVPKTIEPSAVKATYHDGILEVLVPLTKAEAELAAPEPKRIPVEAT